MAQRPTTLERAFELARTGEYAGISDIRARLIEEGFANAAGQLYGRSLVSQLKKICAESRAARG